MATATFTTADQLWQDGVTIYWFDLEGETYGIVEGDPVTENVRTGVVDCDCHPIDYNESLRLQVERECVVTDEIRKEASGL